MEQPYLVAAINNRPSKHGGDIWVVELIGLEDRRVYQTYIDANNRNYRHWARVIENPDRGYILSNLKHKVSAQGRTLVSADSQVIIEREANDPDQLAEAVQQIWTNQDGQ